MEVSSLITRYVWNEKNFLCKNNFDRTNNIGTYNRELLFLVCNRIRICECLFSRVSLLPVDSTSAKCPVLMETGDQVACLEYKT